MSPHSPTPFSNQYFPHSHSPTPQPMSTSFPETPFPPPPPNPIPPHNAHSMYTRSKAGIYKPKLFIAILKPPIPEPNTISQALVVTEWKQAMQSEFDALISNKTWKLVPCSADMNLITSKWLFRVKYNKDGSVERYKARLVTRGFQQQVLITSTPLVQSSSLLH